MSQGRLTLAALALSAAGLVGIVSQEGYTDRAVIPVRGDKPTFGFGSTTKPDGSPVRLGDSTTPPKALIAALADMQEYEGVIKKCVKVQLYQHEYDAYVSLAYNVGPGAFCNSTLVKRLNLGDYAAACAEILRWRFFQGKDCSLPEHKRLCGGLWSRRQWENALCMGASS